MSNYKPRIESNNLDLTSILSTINELPDAGASVELGWFKVSSATLLAGTLVEFPLIVGMTWAEWLNTSLNVAWSSSQVETIMVEDNGYVCHDNEVSQKTYVSIDGTAAGRVLSSDKIINENTYSAWVDECCFTAQTQILTALGGDTKAIEDISVGDHVVSYNVDTGENYVAEVKRVIVHENTTDIAEVCFDNGSMVTMNAYHPLYTERGFHSITNYMGYETLAVGDNVKTVHGWTKITAINRYFSEPVTTYNIDVRDIGEEPDIDTNDTFFANGIVAKNPPPSC